MLFPVLKSAYNIYSSKERSYSYKGINVRVMPGVFHPGLFFSTKLLIEYISKYDLNDKNVLELGAGSGLISVYCAKLKANVTASDINPIAVENINQNSKLNSVIIKVIESDLFDRIETKEFDYIIINPPYFPKNPNNDEEFAWFCGNDFQYFKKLFNQIGNYVNNDSKIIMVLSEDCDIEIIKKIGEQSLFIFTKCYEQKIWGEMNYIFEISKTNIV
ncbi:MAG: methyltransferase [Ignavibacteriales bacterium]|nr:methyltransferase [Ignavibacteriales bacterium]